MRSFGLSAIRRCRSRALRLTLCRLWLGHSIGHAAFTVVNLACNAVPPDYKAHEGDANVGCGARMVRVADISRAHGAVAALMHSADIRLY